MTTLNGYIEGLGSGADRIVRKTGKEVKLSVFDNIDNVIVFNQAGETSQKTLTGKNLFNKDDASLVGDYFITNEGKLSGQAYFTQSIFLPIEPNTTYTVSKTAGKRFGLATFTAYPTANMQSTSYVFDQQASHITITSGASDTYLVAYVFNGQVDTGTVDDMLASVQIEKGSTATDYEPYCGGVPSPNPDYPQDINGIGFLYHGAYAVAIDYDDGDEHYGRILATGLSYPLYEGDILDFANSKVIRAKACIDLSSLSWVNNNTYSNVFNGALTANIRAKNTTDILSNRYQHKTSTEVRTEDGIAISAGLDIIYIHDLNFTQANDFKTWLQNNETLAVYSLNTPTDEYITIEGGDISDIGTARVMADGTLTVKYDKAEMAVRKYSAKPDWQKIGYTDTPQIILDAFDYSKRIYDTWTPSASYASKYRGDKELKFFPDVDLTGATNYSAMFQESGILSTPPLTIGDGSNTVINSQGMFQTSPIEKIELTTSETTQKVQIANIFNGCTMLKNAKLTLSASGSMQYAFADCNRLERIEDGLETSDVTSLSEAFRACSSLLYLYELDLSSCTTCYRAFYNCTSLYSAPYLNNIRTGGNFQQMFWNCSSLRILPPYNLRSPSNLENMFQGTGSNLEEASRRNILFMLAGCTYSGTKTLAHLGFTASMYSAASWQALPGYNDFVSAGWSIGYN